MIAASQFTARRFSDRDRAARFHFRMATRIADAIECGEEPKYDSRRLFTTVDQILLKRERARALRTAP